MIKLLEILNWWKIVTSVEKVFPDDFDTKQSY